MKKRIFVLLVLLCFLSQFDIAKAQYQTYLPVILSSGEKMSGFAILEISDGTTTVNLLAKEKETGFHLLSWRTQIIQPKDGGVYQDSSIAPGRDLVFAVDGTANEIFNTRLNGDSQDDLIQTAQDLLRLLTKARNYSLTSWQDTPVYIKARAACETNTRYALIKNFTIQDVDNPYSQPFFTANQLVAMNNISIGIERGHWLGGVPGTGECVKSSSVQEWLYQSRWVSNTILPTQVPRSMLQTANGYIYAGESGQILRSIDDGVNWAVNTILPASNVTSLFQARNGDIYAGEDGQIIKSVNDGGAWAVNTIDPTNFVRAIAQSISGRLFAGDDSQIWYSDDNGGSWTSSALPSPADELVYGIIPFRNAIYIAAGQYILKSIDDGITWSILSQAPENTAIRTFSKDDNDIFYIGGTSTYVFYSKDVNQTWIKVGKFNFTANVNVILPITGGLLVADDNDVFFSPDLQTWVLAYSPPGGTGSLLKTVEPALYGGSVPGTIYKNDLSISNMGLPASCEDIIYVANKNVEANLTHIYIDDGGVFGANLLPILALTTLLPAAPAVNDAVYFGIDTSIDNSGPFSSLVFYLSTAALSTTSYTITWEYWNGAAWAALTVKDGTNIGIGALSNLGVSSVHWTPPANWAANAVNGVTAFWVRARVSALVGVLTPPVQQNRNIYSVVNGYVEVAQTEVLGDIPALSQILAHNRSDLDGPGGSAPNLYENRLIVGLRSYNRGPTFQAYLNAADEQNPFGLTVSVGTNTTFGNDINSPTGRSATYNPAGVEAMATRVLYTFGPTIARDYYGRFHAFVRAYRDGGSSTDFTVRLQVTNGSGGVTYTTDTVQLATTSRFEVLDFGMIKIPVAGSLGLSELGDTSTIAVQASAANAAVNLIIYDLILIPTDEWAIDSNDKTNSSLSEVGKSGGFEKVLNIDSVTMPKFPIRSVVQRYGSNLITAIYNSVTPGEAILQANAQQRLWFFAMTTSATGTAYSWLAQPEISHSIQLYKNQRYLSLRGDR